MSDKEKVIDKIKKCLALSKSSNEHEAATALRQAQFLMEHHGINDLDMLSAEASEKRARAGAASQPTKWETVLAGRIAQAFGCKIIFTRNYFKNHGEWVFIGAGATPEIAEYTFRVLFRQAKAARSTYTKVNLKRCKPISKTRRADLYCTGWVNAVTGMIEAFAGNETNTSAIEAYMQKQYPDLRDLDSRDRNSGRNINDREWDDIMNGESQGRNAQLNHGVGGRAAPLAIGHG